MNKPLKSSVFLTKQVIMMAIVLWYCASSAHARPKYNSAFRAMYPKLASATKAARCNVCHVGKKRKTRNDYGIALSKALGAKNVKESSAIRRALQAVETEKVLTQLDNGKDLNDWTGNLTGWAVVDGAIRLVAGDARGNIYSKTRHTANCIIRLQFRATEGADSGVYIHGKQFQVRDYPKAGPSHYATAAKSVGQWNELEFDITDGVAVVKLNGKVIEKAWKIGTNADEGLGLQKERGDFDFRYIRFREKTATNVKSFGDLIKLDELPDRVIKK